MIKKTIAILSVVAFSAAIASACPCKGGDKGKDGGKTGVTSEYSVSAR
ncbi:MAG: hypothetical protein AAFX93_15455 [Verrucomicrobiota bacterium]